VGVTHRISAFLVFLIWGAAPVLSVVHASEEGHRYCAEHGTVEDAQDEVLAESNATPSTADLLSASPATEHQGCAFAHYCQIGRLPSTAAPDLPRVLELTSTEASIPVAPPAPISVLRLAPKTSPPV